MLLPASVQAGQVLQVDVEAYVNWHSGESDHKIFHIAELAMPDPLVWQAYWDLNAVRLRRRRAASRRVWRRGASD